MRRFFVGLCVGVVCLASTHIAKAADEKCVPAPDGLVGWWSGDDSAHDINPGTAPERVDVQAVSGHVNSGMRFSTAGTYLRVPASQGLDVGLSNGFSVEFWANPVDVSSSQPLFEWGLSTEKVPGVHLWIHEGAGRLFTNLVDDKGASHFIASGPGIIKPNAWQHIALTYDKSGMANLYRNGVLMAQADIGSFTPRTSGDLYFGLRPFDEGRRAFYNGALDEIGLYNKVLTQRQIEEIYQAGSAGKCYDSKIARSNTSATNATAKESASAPKTAKVEWSGRCVEVLDNENIAVLRGNKEQQLEVVRLYGIDAPEYRQDYYSQSEEALSKLVLNKSVKVYEVGKDADDGTVIGWVFIGARSVNATLVESGAAWWDKANAPDEAKLTALETHARTAKRGLWADPAAISPAKFANLSSVSPPTEEFQKRWAEFPLIDLPADSKGKPTLVRLKLNEKPMIWDGARYDGFRFKVKRKSESEDFIWCFTAPHNCRSWYIVRRTGDMAGFSEYSYYDEGELPNPFNRKEESPWRIIVQGLPSNLLQNDEEYLIWFSFHNKEIANSAISYKFANLSGQFGKQQLAQIFGLTP